MRQIPNLTRLDLNRNICIDGNSSLSTMFSSFLEEVYTNCAKPIKNQWSHQNIFTIFRLGTTVIGPSKWTVDVSSWSSLFLIKLPYRITFHIKYSYFLLF